DARTLLHTEVRERPTTLGPSRKGHDPVPPAVLVDADGQYLVALGARGLPPGVVYANGQCLVALRVEGLHHGLGRGERDLVLRRTPAEDHCQAPLPRHAFSRACAKSCSRSPGSSPPTASRSSPSPI